MNNVECEETFMEWSKIAFQSFSQKVFFFSFEKWFHSMAARHENDLRWGRESMVCVYEGECEWECAVGCVLVCVWERERERCAGGSERNNCS